MLLVVEQANGGLRHHYLYGLAVDPGDPQNVIVCVYMGPSSAYTVKDAESFVYRRGEDGIIYNIQYRNPFRMVSPNQVPWSRVIGNTYYKRVKCGKGGMLVNGEPNKLRKHKGKYYSQLVFLACNLFSHRCAYLPMDMYFHVY
jgi:hypothetical protein